MSCILNLAYPAFDKVQNILNPLMVGANLPAFRHVLLSKDEELDQGLLSASCPNNLPVFFIRTEDCYLDNGRPIIVKCRNPRDSRSLFSKMFDAPLFLMELLSNHSFQPSLLETRTVAFRIKD